MEDGYVETSLLCHRTGGIGGILESSIMLSGSGRTGFFEKPPGFCFTKIQKTILRREWKLFKPSH
jgi:hypothetical protein